MKKYSIKELVKKIQDKEISCVEVVDYYIKEIEKNRNIENIDMEVYEEVYGKKNIDNVYDSVIYISKYIGNKKKQPTRQTKKSESNNKVLALA